ncbi:hypothetical protein HPB48_014359 [Haemaphysalis longicornis]|uniref:CCHC-type domain-containing protein n=1 Tax=Haemaphysalis longicornis TaxID=44386 RepID=A0A9J6G2E1_HAELO|nr:hypothetical protein HPB48_014359 [Haemaphysalis longicornis]
MTRWARSKSVLQHERQPGEATTWSEFVAQRQQQAAKDGVQLANAARERQGLAGAKKKPGGRKGVPFHDGASSKGGAHADATRGTKGGAQQERRQQRREWAEAVCGEEPSAEGKEDGTPAHKRPRAGPVGGGGSKAGERLQRLRQERESKGLLLLPEKVERRIYQVKKAMRKKGVPGEEIKQVVRKMRRKEELLFRRQLAKLCFKCRQPGHRVSDCPQVLQDPDEAVGICFKCGSTEHFSSACNVQTSKGNGVYPPDPETCLEHEQKNSLCHQAT